MNPIFESGREPLGETAPDRGLEKKMKTKRTMRRLVIAASAAAVVLAPWGPVEAGEKNWRFRFMAAVAGTDAGVVRLPVIDGIAGTAVNGGFGVGINFEYRYAPKAGFEMGVMAMAASTGVRFGKDHYYPVAADFGGYVPMTFVWNYHPLGDRVFDLYVGPLLSSTFYSKVGAGSDWDYGAGVEGGIDFGIGFNLGADINFGKSRWSFNPGIKYIFSSLNNGGGREFDPLIVTFGFGFRF
jgi:outer membrane protein W